MSGNISLNPMFQLVTQHSIKWWRHFRKMTVGCIKRVAPPNLAEQLKGNFFDVNKDFLNFPTPLPPRCSLKNHLTTSISKIFRDNVALMSKKNS